MEALTKPRLSVAEYLAFEAESEFKHEYHDGEIVAMTGGTDSHSRIKVNAIGTLFAELYGSGCFIYNSDMLIRADAIHYFYPDFSVVCGGARHADASKTTLLNPVLVGEVTSPSTIDFDRGRKLELYQAMPSLEACLILDQRQTLAEVYTREEDGWRERVYRSLNDIIPLPMLECELPLEKIYYEILV